MPLTFDTHAFIKRLTFAGMPEPQAEAVTAMVNEAREIDLANLATKADIQALRTDFVRLEQMTKSEFVQLEQRMTIKLGGLMVAATGLILAAFRVIH